MNKKLLFLGCIVFTILFGCSEDTIEQDVFGALAGTVIDSETNEPLDNVKITTSPVSNTVFTNSDGQFEISALLIDNYSVQAELDNYITDFEGIEILEDRESEVAFELRLSDVNNTAPGTPELLSPIDGAQDVLLEVELAWNSIDLEDDELSYTIELRNGSTNEIQEFNVIADTTYTVNNLSLSTNYFWQVFAKDESNDPVASSVSSFTTFTAADNPFLFVRRINGNNVIFSGNQDLDETESSDVNVLQLTDDGVNSFRPKRNTIVDKIAFIRTINGENHIFTMSASGLNEQQLSSTVPITGFRQESIEFTWAENGQRLYYPSFNKLYAIDNDGSGLEQMYQTIDGSLISDIAVSSNNTSIAIIKTNDVNGYNVRVFAVNLTTGQELYTVLQGQPGAVSGIDVGANLENVIYAIDVTGSQNSNYRIFSSRVFSYNVGTQVTTPHMTDVISGENDLFPSYSPDEGRIILTRSLNNLNATPAIYSEFIGDEGNNANGVLLFTNSFMSDWE